MNYTVYEQVLLILTLITVALQCFVIWLVQKKTPSNMKDYRLYLINFTVWDMMFTVVLGIVFQPFPITPLFASSVRGVALYGGKQFAQIASMSGIYCGSIVICAQDLALLYRWAIIHPDREVYRFVIHKYFNFGYVAFSQGLSIFLAVAFYSCIIGEEDLPAYLETQPSITVPMIPNEVILCFDLTAQKPKFFALTIIALFSISEFFSFVVVFLILRILREHSQKYSKSTRRLHYQFLFLLLAQLLTPIVLIVFPVTLELLFVLAGNYASTLAVQVGYLVITFYGFTNAAFCLWFVGPYRNYVKEKFAWLLKSKSTISTARLDVRPTCERRTEPGVSVRSFL
ncbi:hypothetical protein M3Y94_00018900 [Aphelenchoides besseyi]|nr:hypothetical protein M3Y94_00018900 [Aphelenchoides besseyi]KAI6216504.1 hypothetical protein M3Y95_01271900 [Aphelenchoides besseyi]